MRMPSEGIAPAAASSFGRGGETAGDHLAAMRAEVARIECQNFSTGLTERFVSLGEPAIDVALPGRGLALGALHEIAAADTGAGMGFMAALLARLDFEAGTRGASRRMLWAMPLAGLYEAGNLYTPGLVDFGLDPNQFLFARGRRDIDILWAMEEGLRVPGFAAVVAEVRTLNLNQSQRLALAARRSGVAAFILRPAVTAAFEPSAALTRWWVHSTPSARPLRAGSREAAWNLDLVRVRGGASRCWRVVWQAGRFTAHDRARVDQPRIETGNGTDHFGLAPILGDRSLEERSSVDGFGQGLSLAG
ncbi:MAG: hypothetical protein EXQ91_00450 [Alphaproteobacteria bacterium]|nr:hypothetical protein [Alphaproteobacteria bacterium]